ncbi:thioredoxin-disulfide reductase [Methanohalophilus sp. WG1-DM]|uniref:thioredoxin-disulfide reductase n=1 Tax=Methanohalophilus sp. WG1-DM TaxID=2491675 RepID=UPI000FFE5322|nr:thioredoxin-disulfide reductase [Methanohalophilus sp. WG1-DM]RXG33973.1 thioredoxin reductase (NADPH) [Methanohalophilus sp. WG1-DM]
MYDLIILGAGPAGVTAAIYAVRYGLDTLLVDKDSMSGLISTAKTIENYTGFPSIGGMELMEKFLDHAEKAGVTSKVMEIKSVAEEGDDFIVSSSEEELKSKSLIVATGSSPRELDVPGEKEFLGRGVSYCATCDGPFFSGKEVAVIGGGESAVTDAIFLSDIASKVYLIHRRDKLRASSILQDRAFDRPNIEFVWDSAVDAIEGKDVVESLQVHNVITEETKKLPVNGAFIYIGFNPNTDFVNVKKNNKGFIITDESMTTSVRGIFAAGDCRQSPLYQVITAASDGAIAAYSAFKYIEGI